MSNSVYFIPTKFVDCTPDGKEDVTYGYRLGDDYESYYNNNFSCMENVFEIINNPKELMDEIADNSQDLYQFLMDNEKTIWTGYDYIPYETYSKGGDEKEITGIKPVTPSIQDQVDKLLAK